MLKNYNDIINVLKNKQLLFTIKNYEFLKKNCIKKLYYFRNN